MFKPGTLRRFLRPASICAAIACAAFLVISVRNKIRASECLKNIELLNGAKDEWTRESECGPDAKPTMEDICPYTGASCPSNFCPIICPSGGTYTIGKVGCAPVCSFHGFSIGVYERISEYKGNVIAGAVVETVWSDGHKVKTLTDDIGGALVKAPPNQTATVIISKPGFTAVTNSIESLYTNAVVDLKPLRK